MASLFEMVGGDVESLVRDSPISMLAARMVKMCKPAVENTGDSHKKSKKRLVRRPRSEEKFSEAEVEQMKEELALRNSLRLCKVLSQLKVAEIVMNSTAKRRSWSSSMSRSKCLT